MTKEQAVAWLTTNCDCWKGQQKVLNDMGEDQLAKLKANAELLKAAALTINTIKKDFRLADGIKLNEMPAALKKAMDDKEDEKDKGDDEEAEGEKPVKNKRANNSLADRLTPAELEVWNYATKRIEDDKKAIVNRLIANVSGDAERNRIGNSLMAKKIEELQDLAALLPAQQQTHQTYAYNFAGAGGGPIVQLTDNEAADVLDLESARESYAPTRRKAE